MPNIKTVIERFCFAFVIAFFTTILPTITGVEKIRQKEAELEKFYHTPKGAAALQFEKQLENLKPNSIIVTNDGEQLCFDRADKLKTPAYIYVRGCWPDQKDQLQADTEDHLSRNIAAIYPAK